MFHQIFINIRFFAISVDNRKNEQLPKGLYTLLLLDTSYSIGPGGLYEMKKFINEFLDGKSRLS